MTTAQLKKNTTSLSGQPSSAQRWLPGFAWIVLVLPILFFTLIWQFYAINIPKWDDHALRAFLFYSDQEPSLTGKIYQLFKQHNEHRIVYDRLITKLDYTVFGKLNFVHLMLVGNLSLVGLLVVFMAALRRSLTRPHSVVYALPIALLIFNLSQWENMYWGMAALQNFSVVLWVTATFYFLSYTRLWGLALVSATLATLTSGNGLMVWPIGFVILVLRFPAFIPSGGRRPFRALIGWLAGAALVIGLYFTGFEKPGGIDYVKPGFIDLIKGWFAVLGAAAEAFPISAPLRLCIGLGGVLVLATVGSMLWGLWTNRHLIGALLTALLTRRPDPFRPVVGLAPITLFFWSCAGFILGTAIIVAWARTGFGVDLLITSRYKMYSLTGLSLLYLYAVVQLPGRLVRWWMVVGVAGSFAFAVLSYYAFLDEAIWWRHWNLSNQFNSTYPTNKPVFLSDAVTQRYTPPTPAFYDTALPTLFGPARQPVLDLSVSAIPSGFSVQNATLPFQGFGDEGAYLVAKSDKRSYLFPVWQNQQSVVAARFLPAALFTNGFKATVLDAQLERGTYQLFVLTMSGKQVVSLHPTNQQIVSHGAPNAETTKNW